MHLKHMKKCIPAFLFLFFVISSVAFTAKGQSHGPVKNDKVDSTGEEVDIYCFFPEFIEPDFPGGMGAWISFIRRNLKYPAAAVKANIQGTVVVQFVVDLDGNVTNIKTVSGPGELKQAAMNVIKKSPKWNPAVQNGHRVKGYKTQPIVFRIEK
ncbi:hypothetical protein A4D02_32490 [Niastella koreensis]|uniref:TonB family protein n=4 Tax=Niastella koreensis TaxID=354356 RepID=G8T7B4_NIAKG|nr:TonB family protein [Niastella koreensis GR20-10]OQP45919.1 hypothetical protein A4D02_32490 [Niastella koreensis]